MLPQTSQIFPKKTSFLQQQFRRFSLRKPFLVLLGCCWAAAPMHLQHICVTVVMLILLNHPALQNNIYLYIYLRMVGAIRQGFKRGIQQQSSNQQQKPQQPLQSCKNLRRFFQIYENLRRFFQIYENLCFALLVSNFCRCSNLWSPSVVIILVPINFHCSNLMLSQSIDID